MDKVVHFEIPYDDEARATEFYKKVFGWGIQAIPDMNYHIAHTAEVDKNNMIKEIGAINGGMYKRDEKSARNPVVVISVDNVDESVKKILESGGKVVREKVKVGEMGLYAQVEDTEGNVIGVWENVKKKVGEKNTEEISEKSKELKAAEKRVEADEAEIEALKSED